MHKQPDVLIVGAGLAGLCCAKRLCDCNISCHIVEASDAVGGRVRTDYVEGFTLDRGFQVLLTAYPEAQHMLDYAALELRPFYPGALSFADGRFHRLADPWRRPLDAMRTVFDPIGTMSDKLRVARLRHRVLSGSLEALFQRPEITTLEALRSAGFSQGMIDRFFRPFLGGVFLERDLRTSSHKFEFVFRMFALGDIALPAAGMGAIPMQLMAQLPQDSVQTSTTVQAVTENGVTLSTGAHLTAPVVVVATDGPTAARLLQLPEAPASRSTACLYFTAEKPPIAEPILVLNGEPDGPVNNLCVPSAVAPSYAPPGRVLVSATVFQHAHADDTVLEGAVRAQLIRWFGREVDAWRHLRTYRIKHALPEEAPPALAEPQRPVRLRPGRYVCGDHRDTASIQGAMVSGRRAAEAILEDLASSTTAAASSTP